MSKQNKKILLLSVSAGAGHTRAAEAIRAFADHHPAGIEATHLDVMDFVSTGFRKLYTDLYIKLVSSQPALGLPVPEDRRSRSRRAVAEDPARDRAAQLPGTARGDRAAAP